MLINLHNLQTRIRPLLHAQLLQLRRAQLRNAKRAVARLIKAVEQADVKGRDFVAEAERHVRVRPRVADLEVQGAAGEGPGGAVVGADFLGDVCACVLLRSGMCLSNGILGKQEGFWYAIAGGSLSKPLSRD